ncbi:MAG: TonB-dependent receptor [Bacteroidota bacterium]
MRIPTTLFIIMLSKAICAQNDSTINTKNLDEIIFSANKTEESSRVVSQQVTVIKSKQIQSLGATTTGDMLANFGAVSLQKSQQGGGSPTIRGFEASRVVLMIDGVRMNNLIYRAGHLQNIVTIDQSILERAEVLYGPSSTVYGSDALGGIIHFYTKNPELNSVKANTFFRFRAPNQEKTGNFNLNLGGKKFASLSSVTFSSFEDLKMGKKTNPSFGSQFGLRKHYVNVSETGGPDLLATSSDPFIQQYTGYQQVDVLQKFLFKPSVSESHILNFQYSTSTDVPRYDRLTDPLNKDGSGLKSAEWYYGPQKRLMTAYDFRKNTQGRSFHIGSNFQSIEESRHDRPFEGKFLRSRIENVNVWGLNADISRSKAKYESRYGVDIQYNRLASTAIQKAVNLSGENKTLNTRYPDGDNTMINMAVYTTESWIISDKIRINDGLRIGYSDLSSEFLTKTFFPFPYNKAKQNYLVYSGNIGLNYTPTNDWKIYGLIATGFRAPNVDDLAKVFESAKGTLIVPNPDLKPEKTINYELGIHKSIASWFNWENVIYTTKFRDAIVTDLFTLGGQSEVVYDGVKSKVLANQNKRRANIWGFSSTFNFKIHSNINFYGSYNYTEGKIIQESGNSPLDHIPPSYGKLGITGKFSKLDLELFGLWNGWKHIENYLLNGEDNEVYATPKGMPAWKTLNLRANYHFTEKWSVLVGVDNIFDLQYRTFASGINSPGRNAFFAVRGSFGK